MAIDANRAAYERFVDKLVDISAQSVAASRIRRTGHPVRSNDADLPLNDIEQRVKDMFLRLSAEDRNTFADVLLDERRSALHDFAAFLEWAIACDDMCIVWADGEIGIGYNTMHGDFVGRLAGDEWSQYRED
jgi:hypothetical protein